MSEYSLKSSPNTDTHYGNHNRTMNEEVMILGAGLAGLGAARELPGARIFEAANHPGGHCYSHELDGVFFDEGAHICHAKDPDWLTLLYQAASDVEQIAACDVRCVRDHLWMGYPVQNNLRHLPLSERITALKDFVRAISDPSCGTPTHFLEWCRSQYGDYLTEVFYRVYTDKYWRVGMEELGVDWLGGRLLPSQIERIIEGAFSEPSESQAVFAQFHYPARGGFYAFFSPLFQDQPITYHARAIELNIDRREVVFDNGLVESYDALATSIPLPELVGMIPSVPDSLQSAVAMLRHTQLLVVNMIIDRPSISPCHWFYIYDSDIDVSRVKVNSNIAPRSVPVGRTALQCEIFRRADEPMPANELTDRAVLDMAKLFDFDVSKDVRAIKSVHISHAYVISDLQRAAAIDTIIPWLEERGIYTMGLFGRWKFIWSDAAFRSGQETAGRILARCK